MSRVTFFLGEVVVATDILVIEAWTEWDKQNFLKTNCSIKTLNQVIVTNQKSITTDLQHEDALD